MDITTPQYIYLLHTREFINCKMPVYKIGKTKKPNFERFSTYPKGFVILLHTICRDCSSCEKKVISLFDKKYKKRTDFGNEYYEGNYKEMKKDINDIVETDNDIFDNETEKPIPEKVNEVSVLSKSNIENRFHCEKCRYFTNKKQDYEKHIVTKKHLDIDDTKYDFECKKCSKIFITNSGLWRHNKKCKK
jgi:hypothetical protein